MTIHQVIIYGHGIICHFAPCTRYFFKSEVCLSLFSVRNGKSHTPFYFCPTVDCLSYYCVCPVITILVFTQQSSCTQIETVQKIGRTKQFGPNMLRPEQAQGQQHILVLTCDMCRLELTLFRWSVTL